MAKYLDATGVSTLWGKIKSSFASTGHTHNYLPLSGGTITGNLIIGGSDIPEVSGNLSSYASLHSIKFYRNGFLIPYQMENTNDGGFFRVRGTTEDNVVCEIGTWDDSGAGETIQFNYYPTTSTVTPTYSVSVPKATGTLALTSQIPTNNNQLTNGAGYITSSGSCNYATSAGNADTVNGYDETSFFRYRGVIDVNYVDLTTYSSSATNYQNPKNGIWNVERPGYSAGLITFTGTGSASGLDIYFHYAKGYDFKFRRRIDSNRLSGDWESFITSENIGSQSVNYANSAGSVAWTSVTNKPSTFTPSSHTHDYLPLSGGTMTDTPYINMPASAASISDSQPFGITYGKVQCYGNLILASDTDGSQTEYTIITSGYGVSNATVSNGLAIGYNSLTWKGNNIIHSGNISSQSVNYANSSNIANYLPTLYIGGDQPNPQTYFSSTIGLRAAMTRYADIGMGTAWHDTLWINGYSGGDVPYMCALHFKRNGEPRFAISSQQDTGTSYGTMYEVITNYNISSQSVNYATSSGTANSPRGFSFSDRSSSDWTGVPGTFIADWAHSSGADIMFKYNGGALNVITDGYFYQGIDYKGASYRVLDEYDISHTKWGDADTIDGYHYNTLYTSIGDWISKIGNTYTITVNGDSNTYYPVVINATSDKTSRNFISIWKDLGSPTASYPGNHSNGTASMWLIIEGRSCVWDGNGGYYRTIYKSQPYANLISEATTVYSSVSVLCVYLRGGGTEYKISTTYQTGVNVYYSETNIGSPTYPAIVNPRTDVGNGGIISGTFYGNCTGNASTATSASSVPSLSNSEIDNIIV